MRSLFTLLAIVACVSRRLSAQHCSLALKDVEEGSDRFPTCSVEKRMAH